MFVETIPSLDLLSRSRPSDLDRRLGSPETPSILLAEANLKQLSKLNYPELAMSLFPCHSLTSRLFTLEIIA